MIPERRQEHDPAILAGRHSGLHVPPVRLFAERLPGVDNDLDMGIVGERFGVLPNALRIHPRRVAKPVTVAGENVQQRRLSTPARAEDQDWPVVRFLEPFPDLTKPLLDQSPVVPGPVQDGYCHGSRVGHWASPFSPIIRDAQSPRKLARHAHPLPSPASRHAHIFPQPLVFRRNPPYPLSNPSGFGRAD